jgi:peroxiredoxin
MLTAGDHAPSFDLPDLQGRRHRLEEALAAGPALAVFWKAACATCHLAFPYLQRLSEAYPGSGWRLLAVSQDGADTSRDFVEEHALTFPVLIEGEGWPVSRQYDPEATPTLFLIAPDGAIDLMSVGFDKAELNEISRRLAEALGREPVVIAEDGDGNPPFKPG